MSSARGHGDRLSLLRYAAERSVAIKLLHPDLAGGGRRALPPRDPHRQGADAPEHSPGFDSGEIDGSLFYVMPFVEGESLRDRLDRERQLSVQDAVRITSEVADALHYAHTQNIVHRDIKPENILLEGGTRVVADFGIARAVTRRGRRAVTQTGMSLGTPRTCRRSRRSATQHRRPQRPVHARVRAVRDARRRAAVQANTMQALVASTSAKQVPMITTMRPACRTRSRTW